MNYTDPLAQSILDLHVLLGEATPLILGGGYGLYLKQDQVLKRGQRTLFAADLLPDNRTTQDIDLFLRADVVLSAEGMKTVREALDTLGFSPVAGSEFMQFSKPANPAGEIKIDLLVGPLGEFFDPETVKRDERRVRPKGYKALHAHPLDEAVGIEDHLKEISLQGTLSSGAPHTATVYVPQPFTYLVMKLLAFRDRANDQGKGLARHHALDIFRTIALLTEDEDPQVREQAQKHMGNVKVIEARHVAAEAFGRLDSLGILRMREHPLFKEGMPLERFVRELSAILPPL